MTYAEGAEWHNIMEVRQIFPTADGGVKGAYTVFNIKGNDFRLITVIDYELQVIAIIDIFTHAEYSKW